MTTADAPLGSSFYIAGGTLRPDAPSYVERQADRDLYEGLKAGEFCYVLTSRQMGKSSLMVRTAARLRQEGVQVAVLDLTAIGQNLTPEQWYGGLLGRLGRQLDLEHELDAYWEAHARLGPLQRWMAALHDMVLARCPGRVVMFVDEIDATSSLPFSADEFFAGIRECYTRRAEDPEFEHLTFCLLGVATPSDLIQDTRTTPFNIGRRIELTDFTTAEAAPLAAGLHRDRRMGAALLQRTVAWTGGHSYLTQRLCQALAQDGKVTRPASVDQHCEALFLSSSARERDDNLLFVRERLLKSEADAASLLDLYARVRGGKRVRDDDTNRLVSILKLSGVTRVVEGCLRERNRIYAQVFDRDWIAAHMPDAERRRQRAAYRLGLLRATGAAGLVVLMVAGLALVAVRARDAAIRSGRLLEGQRETNRSRLVRQLVDRGMGLVDGGDLFRALPYLVEAHRLDREAGKPDDFHRMRLAALLRHVPRLVQFWQHDDVINRCEISRDGRRFLTASWDGTARVWQVETGEPLGPPIKNASRGVEFPHILVPSASLSPDGRTVVSLVSERVARLWKVGMSRPAGKPLHHAARIRLVRFSPDGGRVVTASDDGTARVWDAVTGDPLLRPLPHRGQVTHTLFAREGRLLVTGTTDREIRQWDLRTGRPAGPRCRLRDPGPQLLAVSPDGRVALTGFFGGARLHSLATGRALAPLLGHTHVVRAGAFSADGRRAVTAGWDGTARVWDTATGTPMTSPLRHGSGVNSASFSPDGRLIATGSSDHLARVWDAASGEPAAPPLPHAGPVSFAEFAPDGRRLFTSDYGGAARLWDLAMVEDGVAPLQEGGAVWHAACSSDGARFATTNKDGRCRVWVTATGEPAGHVLRHPEAHTVEFSPDGRRVLITAGQNQRDGWIGSRVWDWSTGRPLTPYLDHEAPDRQSGHLADFSLDGRWVLTAGVDGIAQVWGVENGARIGPPLGHGRQHGKPIAVKAAAFGRNGERVYTVSADGLLRCWRVGTGRLAGSPIATKAIPDGNLGALFSPDRRRLATVSGPYARLAHVWDTETGTEVFSAVTHSNWITNLEFSRDGTRLVTTGWDPTARIWDARTGRLLIAPLRHRGRISGASLSADGRLVATASFDRTARVWDSTTGEAITPPLRHTGVMLTAVLTPDGQSVITGSELEGETLRLWRLPRDRRPAVDLVRLSELLSCQRLDPQTGVAALPSRALHATWQDLRARYPAEFRVTRDQERGWYRQQAREREARGDPDAPRSRTDAWGVGRGAPGQSAN